MSNVDHPGFRRYIRKFCGAEIRSAVTLDRNHSYELYDECVRQIFEILKDDKLWFGVDETTDAAGRTVAGMILGSIDDPKKGPFLVEYDELIDGSAHSIANFVIKSFESVFGPLLLNGNKRKL